MTSQTQDLYMRESELETSSNILPALEHIKALSEPIMPMLVEPDKPGMVEKKTSAPSYLYSLSHNGAPPFRKPDREPRRRVLIGEIMTQREAIDMVAASEADPKHGMRKYLELFVAEKKITEKSNRSETNFLVSFIKEMVAYAARLDFNARKLSVLITLYLSAHKYFKSYYWTSPRDIWSYFKDILIRHTINNSPDAEEVFEPDESYDILTHFHTMYMTNLPLIHIRTFGVYRLKFEWPFNP